ncbi:uncharacterized protein [Nicotiana sylvestris]|uniref:uncharacterized protein n=1 Tax=Nicotiana sylvestris TaxID=4096 RepID=UPI00388C81D6
MSNVNDNNQQNLQHQENQEHQENQQGDGTPFENDQAIDEALKKLIAQQVSNALQAFANQLSVIPPTPTPNNNTMENPRSGLVNSGSGGTPNESHDGGSDSFIKAYLGAQKVEKRMEDIFKIKQRDTEPLREFIDRFQRERMMLPRAPDNWAAMAFASNLNEKSSEATRRLKESLREFPATAWNDVYNRYNTKPRIEENTIIQSRKDERVSSRRAKTEKRSGKNRYEPYMDQQDGIVQNRKTQGMILDQDIESQVHYQGYKKNKTCEIHEIMTEARKKKSAATILILLQGEVEHLLKQGYLTELFSKKGKQAYMKNKQEPPKPPSPKRMVNVISGGEEINGVTYTATKKVSKITVTHAKRVRRVLKEDSSSMNIILLRVVNEMQVDDKLIPKAHTLSSFDNLSVVTKREIILTTFVEGVVKDTKFQVLEMDRAYNIILGRPWIHEMDDVPSILHQVIKFPSLWGIPQIRGDQQASQSINTMADSRAKRDKK